jgi:hypothetical protein
MEDPTQANPATKGETPFQVVLQTPGEEWTPVTLEWVDFAKAEWVGESGVDVFDPTRVVDLYLEVGESQSGSIWFDDLQLADLEVAAAEPAVPPTDTPAPTNTPDEIVYYVAPTGNDSNPGTESQPWQTIQKAADSLVAGDTVYVRAGTFEEQIIPLNSGSAGNYITYAAYPGETVTIDGSSITLPAYETGLFKVEDRSYIKVSGLRVINAAPNDNNAGIYVYNSDHIIIENNYTYNTVSSGIGVWNSNNIIIDGNEVELACNDGEQECITVAKTHTFEVRNNHVHHNGPGTNGGEGIDVKEGSYNGKVFRNHVHNLNNRVGIYVDAWTEHTYNIEVFENVVHDVDHNGFALASEAGGLLENIKFHNNVAYNNTFVGLHLIECCVATHPLSNIQIVNNTFYNNGREPWGGGILLENPQAEGVVIRNNICSQNYSFQIDIDLDVPAGNFTADHNLIDGFRGAEGEIYGDDYVEGDPRFVNPAGGDFHLQQDSPAIDKGSPTDAPDDDFEGNLRPQGTGYDIGAYEY